MKVSDQLHAPPALPPENRHNIHRIGGWMNPRADMDEIKMEKISFICWESNPDPSFV
jgi:hypothetical protein